MAFEALVGLIAVMIAVYIGRHNRYTFCYLGLGISLAAIAGAVGLVIDSFAPLHHHSDSAHGAPSPEGLDGAFDEITARIELGLGIALLILGGIGLFVVLRRWRR